MFVVVLAAMAADAGANAGVNAGADADADVVSTGPQQVGKAARVVGRSVSLEKYAGGQGSWCLAWAVRVVGPGGQVVG